MSVTDLPIDEKNYQRVQAALLAALVIRKEPFIMTDLTRLMRALFCIPEALWFDTERTLTPADVTYVQNAKEYQAFFGAPDQYRKSMLDKFGNPGTAAAAAGDPAWLLQVLRELIKATATATGRRVTTLTLPVSWIALLRQLPGSEGQVDHLFPGAALRAAPEDGGLEVGLEEPARIAAYQPGTRVLSRNNLAYVVGETQGSRVSLQPIHAFSGEDLDKPFYTDIASLNDRERYKPF